MSERTADAGGVNVSAWVPADVAVELRRLAAAGDRSVSREAGRALRQYVRERRPLTLDDAADAQAEAGPGVPFNEFPRGF